MFTGDSNRGLQVGYNSGFIENHFHIPTERPETPPQPSCFVPFRRDPDFVNRKTLLDQIHQRCSVSASRVALVGLGGVGKSQLAIEYCYRTAEHSPGVWVLWMHASNMARLEASFREIADLVKVRGRRDAQADVFKLVHDWLRDERNGPWLLVLDNADDVAVLSPQPSDRHISQAHNESRKNISDGSGVQHLSRYLPQSRHGSVLVTSRTRHAAMQIVDDSNIISVEPMDDATAHSLLHKKLGDIGDKSDRNNGIAELAAALDHMPLALVQAATYIRRRMPRCSVQKYLEEYRQGYSRKVSLLSQGAGHLRRDEAASNTILVTWQISFDHVRSIRPSAADLLSLMSFFDRQRIPEGLLRNQSRMAGEHMPEVSFDDEFEDDILMLREYSFVTATADENTFDMHSLIQIAIKKWLELGDQVNTWQRAALRIMAAAFPSGQHETWTVCRTLLPHAIKVLGYSTENDKEATLDRATIAANTTWYMMLIGQYAEAEQIGRTAVAMREATLGREHPETLNSINRLGLVLERQGKYEEAEAMHRHALEGYEMVFGQEHPDTLTSTSHLGIVLERQGEYEQAEAMQRRALEGLEKVLGLEHLERLISVSNLGSVLENQGRYNEAEARYRQGLEGVEKLLGPEHPDTLSSARNLGSVLERQGRYEEAEIMHRRALVGYEKVFEPEHPDMLTSYSSLGWLLLRQGKCQEAMSTLRKTLEQYEKVLGPEHPDTLTSVINLGSVLERQGEYKQAEAMHHRALEGLKNMFGPEHPETLISASHLGMALGRQGKYKEAEAMHRRTLEGSEKVLGPDHPDTLTSVSYLGSVLQEQGNYKEAEAMYRRALVGYEKVFGPEHPDTLTSVSNLGSVLQKQYIDEYWKGSRGLLGPEHPDTLAGAKTLGMVLENRGKYEDVEAMHRQALVGYEKVLVLEHPDMLITLGWPILSAGVCKEVV